MPVQRTRPLQDHPQFSVHDHQSHREYRVENWRLARDGSGKIIRSYGWTWFDLVVPVLVAVVWGKITTRTHYIILAIIMAYYVYCKCTQILWESVFAVPYIGLQLETHRGLPNIPLFVSRRFIPAVYLRDFIINEGLHGWNVRYYLAAIKGEMDGNTTLHVAYENILPYFPVLLHVYRDVHSVMFTDTSAPSEPHTTDHAPDQNVECP